MLATNPGIPGLTRGAPIVSYYERISEIGPMKQ